MQTSDLIYFQQSRPARGTRRNTSCNITLPLTAPLSHTVQFPEPLPYPLKRDIRHGCRPQTVTFNAAPIEGRFKIGWNMQSKTLLYSFTVACIVHVLIGEPCSVANSLQQKHVNRSVA